MENTPRYDTTFIFKMLQAVAFEIWLLSTPYSPATPKHADIYQIIRGDGYYIMQILTQLVWLANAANHSEPNRMTIPRQA